MRMIVFFDLPVKTKNERREATRFRNFLMNDGYHMLQFSVYARVCNGLDAVEKHRVRLKQNLPNNGAIRMLVITEKQYSSIEILLGRLTQADERNRQSSRRIKTLAQQSCWASVFNLSVFCIHPGHWRA